MADLDFDTALQTLHQHSPDPSNESLSKAIIFLGEASSKSSTDRSRLSKPDTLKALLDLLDASLATSPPAATATPTFRCIGNAIISSDEGRQIVTDHGFGWVEKCLASGQSDAALKTIAFKCLYNICCDYAPAQKRCFQEHVHEDALRCYVDLYGNHGQQDRSLSGLYCDLLLSIVDKREEGEELQLRDEASREFLLDFPHLLWESNHATDSFATAVEAALVYMRDGKNQKRLVEERLVVKVWRMLEEVEEVVGKEEAKGNEEDVKLLVPLATSLTWCLSDIAANETFAEQYANHSELIHEEVICAIESSGLNYGFKSSRVVSAACQVVGNLLWAVKDRDPSTYDIDVMDERLHRGLMNSTSEFKDAETLYSVVGLLIQLCRHSSEYRARLCGDEKLSPTLKAFCESDSKEVRQGGMKLLQLLGKDNAAIREKYAGLAKQVMESLLAEQGASQQANGGSVVELPD